MHDDHSLILAIDQGTTSSRAILFDLNGTVIQQFQQEFTQYFPTTGHVEHDPEEIWSSVLQTTQAAINYASKHRRPILGIGITNQRETTLVWNRKTGKPIYNAIVWQDRRTADICDRLKAEGALASVQSRTGLLLDPYFSATKVAWILDNINGARTQAERGELAFGTIDSFLIWRLSGGLSHTTDITNASRTNLYNIHQQQWDNELLKLFNVPSNILPEVLDCAAPFGVTAANILEQQIPILAVAGDQQAAAIGQACFQPGESKSTYGTGCFVLVNTGTEVITSDNKLLSTVAYRIRGKTHYALEGSIFVAGAAIQWLRDGLGIIAHAKETESLAASLESNHGVYLVPAFTGMGAPYWNAQARGALFGLTRATGKAEIARAALESVCYQTADLLEAMDNDGIKVKQLKVDGGMVANNWLSQCLADTLNLNIERPQTLETTALGVAYLVAMETGVFSNLEDIAKKRRIDLTFSPSITDTERVIRVNGWRQAVQSTLGSVNTN